MQLLDQFGLLAMDPLTGGMPEDFVQILVGNAQFP
jgi:hypothetical protein